MKLKDHKVTVTKVTDENLMREACEMTFLGTSHQTLKSMYRSEHSPVRTQIFWIRLENIPLFVATHLIRHHVGSQPYQLTCREDREGGNPGLSKKVDEILRKLVCMKAAVQNGTTDTFDMLGTIDEIMDELIWIQENTDRYTPVNLGLLVNAQSLIDMAKLRECTQASEETRQAFTEIRTKVGEIDPDLALFMVPKCVYCGGLCHEPKCCGYNKTSRFAYELGCYVKHAIGKKNSGYFGDTEIFDAIQ